MKLIPGNLVESEQINSLSDKRTKTTGMTTSEAQYEHAANFMWKLVQCKIANKKKILAECMYFIELLICYRYKFIVFSVTKVVDTLQIDDRPLRHHERQFRFNHYFRGAFQWTLVMFTDEGTHSRHFMTVCSTKVSFNGIDSNDYDMFHFSV